MCSPKEIIFGLGSGSLKEPESISFEKQVIGLAK